MKIENKIAALMMVCLAIGFLTYGVFIRYIPVPETSVLYPRLLIGLNVLLAFKLTRDIKQKLPDQ